MKIRGWELQFWTFPIPFYLPCVWHFLQEHPANNHRLLSIHNSPRSEVQLCFIEIFSKRSLHRELLGSSQHLRTGYLWLKHALVQRWVPLRWVSVPEVCWLLLCVSCSPSSCRSLSLSPWAPSGPPGLWGLSQIWSRPCCPFQFKHLSQFSNPSQPQHGDRCGHCKSCHPQSSSVLWLTTAGKIWLCKITEIFYHIN